MSKTLKEMLRTRKGYRCEGYSGSGVRRADRVVEFETFDLGNEHVLHDVCKAICKKKCDWDERYLFNQMKEDLKGYDAVWLTTKKGADRYCEEGEPDEWKITKDMIPTSDLGVDGTLFLRRSR